MENLIQSVEIPLWATILQISIWPLIIIVLIIYFGPQIKKLFSRISKFSVAGIDIKIAKTRTITNEGSLNDLNLFGAIPNVGPTNSYRHSLINLVERNAGMDYIVIDLGAGDKWLTSRLFIISNVLARNAGLKSIVFVRSIDGRKKQEFLGLISVDKFRWAIASLFISYEKVFCNLMSKNINEINLNGAIGYEIASSLVIEFINRMQNAEMMVGNQNTVRLENEVIEIACWLDEENITTLLDPYLDSRTIISNWPKKIKINKVLKQKSDFVAIVDKSGRFKELINRKKLVEVFIETIV